ncbi:hypothetical protein E2C01_094052 [Portunus trituberculatus]|uniref:Uncharacterized protein n=1 Tax=Portunus trituberculatus TaxID=210409 RepID=A0A5B7JRH2_PORTR|nr:hypothetical protein [Portunus trituberculatus]
MCGMKNPAQSNLPKSASIQLVQNVNTTQPGSSMARPVWVLGAWRGVRALIHGHAATRTYAILPRPQKKVAQRCLVTTPSECKTGHGRVGRAEQPASLTLLPNITTD